MLKWSVRHRVNLCARLMSKVVEEKDVANPRIATLMRPRFDHIPPTLLIVAECDPLRDDSYGSYQRLSSMRHCID